jgi:hypothetical protein
MKRFIRIVAVAAATLMITIGLTGRAMAADHTMHTGDVWGRIMGWSGKGWFNEHGDVVTICDAQADGVAVEMFVYYDKPTGNPMYSFHVGGKGRCVTRKASMGGVYNLQENHYVGFKFCRYQGGECRDYRFFNDH